AARRIGAADRIVAADHVAAGLFDEQWTVPAFGAARIGRPAVPRIRRAEASGSRVDGPGGQIVEAVMNGGAEQARHTVFREQSFAERVAWNTAGAVGIDDPHRRARRVE